MQKIDLTGMVVGRLTVLYDSGERRSGIPMWECKCSCGNYVRVHGSSLRGGKTLSCGCYQREQVQKATKNDLTGDKYGRLTVLKDSGIRKGGEVCWECLCDCGKVVIVRAYLLRNNSTSSCGCLHVERTRDAVTKHGQCSSKVYRAWVNMIDRCCRPSTINYNNYGGRGISICDEWYEFINFYKDMGDPPSPDYSLDRIDPNGNYTKDNCRWATDLQQANNKNNNRILVYNGESRTMADWERYLNLPYGIVRHRLYRGWDIEKALTTPPLLNKKKKK